MTLPKTTENSILSLLVPTLVGFLKPKSRNALHDSSLQLLLKFARGEEGEKKLQTIKDFKSHVDSLSETEKNLFQESVKQSLKKKTVTKDAPKAIPLTL